jgi:transposase
LSGEGKRPAPWPKTLGLSDQRLHNRLKPEAAGGLRELTSKAVSAEQLEIGRLKAELAKTRMERNILKKAAAYFARASR